MWIAILIASAITIMFALLFGLESARLHYVMVAGLAALIGTNLFLVAELNYPYRGGYLGAADQLPHGRTGARSRSSDLRL